VVPPLPGERLSSEEAGALGEMLVQALGSAEKAVDEGIGDACAGLSREGINRVWDITTELLKAYADGREALLPGQLDLDRMSAVVACADRYDQGKAAGNNILVLLAGILFVGGVVYYLT